MTGGVVAAARQSNALTAIVNVLATLLLQPMFMEMLQLREEMINNNRKLDSRIASRQHQYL